MFQWTRSNIQRPDWQRSSIHYHTGNKRATDVRGNWFYYIPAILDIWDVRCPQSCKGNAYDTTRTNACAHNGARNDSDNQLIIFIYQIFQDHAIA
jgi:hypothetical protein